MPSKIWLAAASGVTALLLVILIAQHSGGQSGAAPTRSTAGGTNPDGSSNTTVSSPNAAKLDEAVAATHAYCNVSGPCESCPPPSGAKDTSAKLRSCEESGYRKAVTCVLAKTEDAPLHELLLEAYHAGDHSPGERFDTHAPCGAESGAGMSVAAFEWLMVALLCVSCPVMLWRRWATRQLLPL